VTKINLGTQDRSTVRRQQLPQVKTKLEQSFRDLANHRTQKAEEARMQFKTIAQDVLAEWLPGYHTLKDGTQIRIVHVNTDNSVRAVDTRQVDVFEVESTAGQGTRYAVAVTVMQVAGPEEEDDF
jgi:hypothetical protein